MDIEYHVVRSARKTVKLSISDGKVLVSAPYETSDERIADLLKRHTAWIASAIERDQIRSKKYRNLTPSEIASLKDAARQYFLRETDRYSKIMGIKYSRIKITSAEKRFGSCNSKGAICFSYRLMLYPEAAREYVIVHELAHLIQMNHSRRFYEIVEKYMPDYKERKSLLGV